MLCLLYYYLSICLFIFSHGIVSLFSIYEFDCPSGIIHPSFTCLAKGDKPRQFLKNWRPITLLNTSCKIASGVIANRFKQIFGNFIDPGQTGFVLGRFIGEKTRLLYDLMQIAEEKSYQDFSYLSTSEKLTINHHGIFYKY